MHQYRSGYPGLNSLIDASPDWMRQYVPRELEDKVTSPTFSQSRDLDVLMVWFKRQNNQRATASPLDDLIKIVALDDHGCKFESYEIGYIGEGSQDVEIGTLYAFPRRQTTFKLQFVNVGDSFKSSKVIAQFEVRNPAHHDHPVWTATPLPATDRLAGLEVTLLGIEPKYGQPRFELVENGNPAQGWNFAGENYFDSTGNKASQLSGLCQRERVIRLSTEFYREANAHFAADETWTISGLKLPKDGEFVLASQTNMLQGVSLQLVALTGAGEFTYSNGIPTEATRQIDPNAPLTLGTIITHGSRPAGTPAVFIKGMPGLDFFPGGERFQVVSKLPHLAVRIRGAKENHRVQLVGSMEIQPTPDQFRSYQYRDIYLFPIGKSFTGEEIKLTFIVQKSRTAIFTIGRP